MSSGFARKPEFHLQYMCRTLNRPSNTANKGWGLLCWLRKAAFSCRFPLTRFVKSWEIPAERVKGSAELIPQRKTLSR